MKIYCSDNTLKVSDIYPEIMGQDVWVLAYKINVPYDEYLETEYLKFNSEVVYDATTLKRIRYNCISEWLLTRNTYPVNYDKSLVREYTDSLRYLDRTYDLVAPVEFYSTEDLIELANEESIRDDEDYDE